MAFAGFRNRGTACGCCGDACIIAQDKFNAALSSSLWTIINGAPSVSGGLLTLAAGDELEFVATPASAGEAVSVTIDARTLDAVGSIRLKIAKADGSNYLFGIVAKSGGAITLRLGQVADGVESWLTDAATVRDEGDATNERHLIRLCWTPGDVEAESEGWQAGIPRTISAPGWTDPDNALLVDGTDVASYGTNALGELTPQMAWFFDFSIPVGSNNVRPIATVHHADQGTDSYHTVDLEMYVFDRTGSEVGDNQGTGTLIGGTFPPAQVRTYGDGTVDFNAGLDWRDVNSLQFGFSIVYQNVSGESTSVYVDGAYLTVHYTVPERRTGRLRLSYLNSSVVETDCVTDWLVQVSGSGLNGSSAGIASESGTWDIGTATYAYQQSATRTGCEACDCSAEDAEPCDCCGDVAGASEYVIVLDNNHTEPPVAGHPDWTPCPLCSGFTGAFTLRNNESCGWLLYQYPFDCPNITAEGEELGFGCGGVGRSFSLGLVESGESCKWRLVVQLWADLTECGGEGPSLSGNYAIYESAELSPAGDCRANMPITLDLVDEGYIAGLPYCDYLGLGTISWGITATLDIA
jgi:hypothetical protein